jgi:hypothetical protein
VPLNPLADHPRFFVKLMILVSSKSHIENTSSQNIILTNAFFFVSFCLTSIYSHQQVQNGFGIPCSWRDPNNASFRRFRLILVADPNLALSRMTNDTSSIVGTTKTPSLEYRPFFFHHPEYKYVQRQGRPRAKTETFCYNVKDEDTGDDIKYQCRVRFALNADAILYDENHQGFMATIVTEFVSPLTSRLQDTELRCQAPNRTVDSDNNRIKNIVSRSNSLSAPARVVDADCPTLAAQIDSVRKDRNKKFAGRLLQPYGSCNITMDNGETFQPKVLI